MPAGRIGAQQIFPWTILLFSLPDKTYFTESAEPPGADIWTEGQATNEYR